MKPGESRGEESSGRRGRGAAAEGGVAGRGACLAASPSVRRQRTRSSTRGACAHLGRLDIAIDARLQHVRHHGQRQHGDRKREVGVVVEAQHRIDGYKDAEPNGADAAQDHAEWPPPIGNVKDVQEEECAHAHAENTNCARARDKHSESESDKGPCGNSKEKAYKRR